MSVVAGHEVRVVETLSELHWLRDVIEETCRTGIRHDLDSEAPKRPS